jgi:bifunctional pyridoxal-dependent enzyme with beta-cystathionase and maltose regulon repressor activities
VRVNAGTVFGKVAAGNIRLNIATPRPILVEAVGRIARALVS